MTVSIHGYPKFKFFLPGTNTLAVGAKLFTYEPGTSTKKTSYQDFGKLTSNTNPIILDANGECTLFLDGKYKLILAPANDTDPPASAYWTLDEVGDTDVTADLVGVSNKIPNGSFETDTDGDGVPDDWAFTAGTGNTLAVDTTANWHGLTSVKHTIASANTSVQQSSFFEVQEGQLEILRWAMIASAADISVTVRMKWYTAAQVFVSNTDVYTDSATNPVAWTDKGVLFTPPSTARYAKLEVRCATTGKNANFDNFRTQAFEHHDVATTVTGLWTFSNQSSVIGGVTASNLVDKSATETIAGDWTFTGASNVYNGIAQANLLDKSATETVAGDWTFTGASNVYNGIAQANLVDKSATEIVSGQWSFDNGLTQFGSTAPGDTWSQGDILEISSTGNIYGDGSSLILTENAYDNVGWKYQNTDFASQLKLAAGEFQILNTVSGAADSAISWSTSLKAESDGTVKGLGGNWLISPDGSDITPNYNFVVYSGGSEESTLQLVNSTTGSAITDGLKLALGVDEVGYLVNYENTDMRFYTNSLQEMSLDASNRGLVVGAPTGDGKGVGTVNAAAGLYVNNIEVPTISSSSTLTNKTIGGVVDTNLVDKSAAETISGLWTFSDAIIVGSAADQGAGTIDVENGVYNAGKKLAWVITGTDTNAGGAVGTWTPSITLDLDTAKVIDIEYELVGTGTLTNIDVRLNSDTGAVYAYILESDVGANPTSAKVSGGTSLRVGYMQNATVNYCVGRLRLSLVNAGATVLVEGTSGTVDPDDDAINYKFSVLGQYDAGGVNITGISFLATAGSYITDGSNATAISRSV